MGSRRQRRTERVGRYARRMAQVPTRFEQYQADFQILDRSLRENGPTWLDEVRRHAFSRFSELGFPTTRRGNENWKYTNVGPIAKATFHYPHAAGPESLKATELRKLAPWDDGWITLVFVNGRFAKALSTPHITANGVRVTNLAEAIATNGAAVKKHLAQHAPIEDDAFTALNTAFLQDGAFVHVSDNHTLPTPLHLVYVSTNGGQPTASYPRTLIVAGKHSQVTVVEGYIGLSDSSYFTNATTEIAVDDGARVEHYRYLLESSQAYHVGVTRVYQGQDSTFSSTSLAKGAALARNDLHVMLDAPGSFCYLKGLYLTVGSQHIDNHINVDHLKPHCTSDQYFKGILGGKSRAVYSGRVVVHRDAQKTNAYQKDLNLILSHGAEVDTKPSLEIYADDVKCGHGATAGALAEDALFYMRSRGLDLETARTLLIQGFASEIIESVSLEPLRTYLENTFSGSIPTSEFGGAR